MFSDKLDLFEPRYKEREIALFPRCVYTALRNCIVFLALLFRVLFFFKYLKMNEVGSCFQASIHGFFLR